MTYDMYRMIFIGGLIMAGIMFVVTVLLFFLLRIPQVIGDLTGANARKGIESIRSQTSSTKTNGAYKPKKSTGSVRNTGKISSERLAEENGLRNTERISRHSKNNRVSEETTLLEAPSNETTVLDGNAAVNETTLLMQDPSSVGVPFGYDHVAPVSFDAPPVANSTPVLFMIERDLTFIHTDEVIV